jgi:hypothetical protein
MNNIYGNAYALDWSSLIPPKRKIESIQDCINIAFRHNINLLLNLLRTSNISYTTIVHALYGKTDVKMIFTFFFCESKKKKKVCTSIEKIIFTSALLYKVYNCCARNITHIRLCTICPNIIFFFLKKESTMPKLGNRLN